VLYQFIEPRQERLAVSLKELFTAKDIGRFKHDDLESLCPAMLDERGQCRSKPRRADYYPLSDRVFR
jgi:hypothetical protein